MKRSIEQLTADFREERNVTWLINGLDDLNTKTLRAWLKAKTGHGHTTATKATCVSNICEIIRKEAAR